MNYILCFEASWSVCSLCDDLEGNGLRGPLTVGPARRVAENKFIIVTGEGIALYSVKFNCYCI